MLKTPRGQERRVASNQVAAGPDFRYGAGPSRIAGSGVNKIGGIVRLVVFTDLDGTLLDAVTYSFEAAGPALEALRAD